MAINTPAYRASSSGASIDGQHVNASNSGLNSLTYVALPNSPVAAVTIGSSGGLYLFFSAQAYSTDAVGGTCFVAPRVRDISGTVLVAPNDNYCGAIANVRVPKSIGRYLKLAGFTPGASVIVDLFYRVDAKTWIVNDRSLLAISPSSSVNMLGSSIRTDESTSSLVYTDLATPGPSLTVNVGPSGKLFIWTGCLAYKTTAGAGNNAYFSIELSGANTMAASDDLDGESSYDAPAANYGMNLGRLHALSGLSPGNTTVKLKYRVNGLTFFFALRDLVVYAP